MTDERRERIAALDALLNAPDPAVTVNDDGSCSPAPEVSREPDATLLAIAGLVNGYHNDGTTLSAAETLRAIADALGQALTAHTPSGAGRSPEPSADCPDCGDCRDVCPECRRVALALAARNAALADPSSSREEPPSRADAKYCPTCGGLQGTCSGVFGCSSRADAGGGRAELDPQTERRLREYLWLSHGHQGVYGDDGEMQCAECRPVWDYKRAPLADVVHTAINSRAAVNLAALSSPPVADQGVREAPACVIGHYCRRHGFIHGAEAEELRERVERILKDLDPGGDDAADALTDALRVMLDDVDARDSLAYLEAPAEPQACGWQSISTAPWQGEFCIIWCPGNRCSYMVTRHGKDAPWRAAGSDSVIPRSPTHWHPPLAPPVALAPADKEQE